MRRLAIGAILVALASLVLFDAFDVPTKLRSSLRPWLLERLGAPIAEPAPKPPPRWARRSSSEEPAILPSFASQLRVAGSEDVNVRRVLIDGISRIALEGRAPHDFEMSIDVPPDGELWLSLNQVLPASVGTAVAFEVYSAGAESALPLFRLLLPARHRGWENVRVDLAKVGVGRATLGFRTTVIGDTGIVTSAIAYWGDMLLRSRSVDARPDITVVLIDTLRPDHLGAYGYARPTSPYMDKLAAGGIRFDRVISSAPWTDPAILSLMTGLYPRDLWQPARHREAIRKRLPTSVTTLSEALSHSGYHTIAGSDHPGVRMERFGRGFDVFSNLNHGSGGQQGWRKTEARHLLARMEQTLAVRAAGPVFCYIHILYPHRPLEPPDGYLEAVGATLEGIDIESMEAEIDRYDAEIRVADDVVRELHAIQRDAGWDEDSIFVIVSDHGEGFGEHSHEEHGNSLYNELLRVPLIMFGPGRLAAGRSVDEVVRLIDLFPTIVELASAPPVDGVRGESLLPLIDSEGPARIAYSEFPHTRIIDAYAIQSRNLKGIYGDPEFGREGWFRLDADPNERQVLDSPPAGAELLAERVAEIRRAPTRHGDIETQGPSDEATEMLRALGYVE